MNKKTPTSPYTRPLTHEEPLLSPQRAFVLQFHPDTDIARGLFSGQVEHVPSGKATKFDSVKTMLAFLDKILTDVAKKSRESKLGYGES